MVISRESVAVPATAEEKIFREWIILEILDSGVDIDEIIAGYIHTDDMYDMYEELLRDLSSGELETAYDVLLKSYPRCELEEAYEVHRDHSMVTYPYPYPPPSTMIQIIQDNVWDSEIHQYFCSEEQIRTQFKTHLETLKAEVLIAVYANVTQRYR